MNKKFWLKRFMHLKDVTPNLITDYLDKFSLDERYNLADEAIIQLFTKFPNNSNLKDILLKISVINDLYSTKIFATFEMAKHIQQLKVDDDIKIGS